jgi:hypothetical protein
MAEIKAKQEEDKHAASLHSFSGDSVLAKVSKPSAEKVDVAKSLRYISTTWKVCIKNYSLFHLLFYTSGSFVSNFTLTIFVIPEQNFQTWGAQTCSLSRSTSVCGSL